MIDLLLVALLQAVEPQPVAEQAPAAIMEPVQSAPAASVEAAQTESSDDQRMVCRTDRTTGSRLRRERVCMTVAQRRAEREALERTQSTNGATQGRCLSTGAC